MGTKLYINQPYDGTAEIFLTNPFTIPNSLSGKLAKRIFTFCPDFIFPEHVIGINALLINRSDSSGMILKIFSPMVKF